MNPSSNDNNKIETKINKTLIFITFTVLTWLMAISHLKEKLHINGELFEAFNNGGVAGNYAKIAYIFAILVLSFVSILWIKALWNNIIPRITNWRTIDYWEAMGLIAILMLFSIPL
jgi:hypothetical protein